MSSKNYVKMLTMFEELSRIEREFFTVFVKASVQAQRFDLDDLTKAKADDGLECPHCRNRKPKMIAKYGIRQGIQRYRCNACERTFSAVTGTFLRGTKNACHVQSMMDGHSVHNNYLVYFNLVR